MNIFARPVFFLLALATCAWGQAIGWRNDGTGEFRDVSPPLVWSAEQNIVWKTALPGRSLASPIVVGRRIFVNAEPAELICLDADEGRLLWQRSHQYVDVFDRQQAAKIEADLAQARSLREQIDDLERRRHEANKAGDMAAKQGLQDEIAALREEVERLTVYPPLPGGDTANTCSTPASDGKSVFAVFGTGIVSSHTLEGKRNWIRFVESPRGDHSASPLLVDGKLIVHLERLIALDAATGETLWQAQTGARHGSPVAARVGESTFIVTPAGTVVRAGDGVILAKNQFGLGHCSPLVHGGVIYACEDGATKAIPLQDLHEPQKQIEPLWETPSARANRLASPVYCDGLLFTVTEQGILEAADAKTGQRVYRERLDFGGGRVDPSIALAGGRLYVSTNRWTTVVIQPGRQYKELARNTLGEREENSSSPAFSGRRMYIRTRGHLYCIGQ